jgi:hypothetical protein
VFLLSPVRKWVSFVTFALQKKSLLTTLRKDKSQITLTREDKNTVLSVEKKMMEELNLFLFDWNRYSKVTSFCACVLFPTLFSCRFLVSVLVVIALTCRPSSCRSATLTAWP